MGYSTGRRPWRSEPPRELADEPVESKQKLFFFGLVILIAFGTLTLQLARMQLVNGEQYRLRAETNRLRQVPILPTRGLIYDRHGVPLVENRASFSAAVVAADLPRDQETQITITLQELTGVPAGEISRQIEERRRSNDPFTPHVIKDKLPEAAAFALRERAAQLPGVRVVVEPRRQYVDGPLLSHVLGFVGRINETEYETLSTQGYLLKDYVGKTGVELTYETLLRGKPGMRSVETDAAGRELRVLEETKSVPGHSTVLTIDLDLQRKVTELLQAGMGASKNGAAVVIEVNTGEVLAMVSLPLYDNNLFTGTLDEAAFARLQTDPGKPMVNHAIAEMYPPGSTFKQVTGLAALQEGIATANTVIFSPGVIYVQNQYDASIKYPFKDWSALGSLDFYGGVSMSSDVYFYYLAGGYSENGRDLFQGLGATTLSSWARRFGLGAVTGIDLPGESEGLVPDPVWKENTVGESWFIGDTYNFGIGQGYLNTTPLQMSLVTAAVANGGNLLLPHVVKELRTADGEPVALQRQNVRRNLGIDLRNINIMREGMRRAIDTGTANTAKSRFVQAAGKTGTAEFGERRPDGSYQEHGWFTGYAPFDKPQIAVAVFLETGGGALTAAPVAGKIFDYYFSRGTQASR
jgi:penicillin-binding protein 2